MASRCRWRRWWDGVVDWYEQWLKLSRKTHYFLFSRCPLCTMLFWIDMLSVLWCQWDIFWTIKFGERNCELASVHRLHSSRTKYGSIATSTKYQLSLFLPPNSMSARHFSSPSQQSISDYSHRPPLQPSAHNQYNNPDELKSSYDDLIDQYSSAPYAAHSDYNTYSTSPQGSPTDHRRSSFPFSPKSPISSKQFNDNHEASHIVYPPQPSTKDSDAPGFWRRVCFLSLRFYNNRVHVAP